MTLDVLFLQWSRTFCHTCPPSLQTPPPPLHQDLVFVSARIQLRSATPSTVQSVATAAHKRLRKALSTLDRMRPGVLAVRAARRHMAAHDSSLTIGGFPAHTNAAPGGALRAKSARSILSGNGVMLDGVLPPGVSAALMVLY